MWNKSLAQQGICLYSFTFFFSAETYLLSAIDPIRFYHQDKGQEVNATLLDIRENGYRIEPGAFLKFPTSTLSKNIY